MNEFMKRNAHRKIEQVNFKAVFCHCFTPMVVYTFKGVKVCKTCGKQVKTGTKRLY